MRIEWTSPPEEEMLLLASAFEAALMETYSATQVDPSMETLVVQMALVIGSSTKQHPGDADACDLTDETLELLARPAGMSVKPQPLLKTALGDWLCKTKMMTPALVIGMLVLALLDITKPGHVEFEDGTVIVQHESEFIMLLSISFIVCEIFLGCHVIMRSIVVACTLCFDWLLIGFSIVFYETVLFVFEYSVSAQFNPSVTYWLLYGTELLLCSIGQASITMMDAWTLSKGARTVVSIGYIGLLVSRYIYARVFKAWGEGVWCINEHSCVQPRLLYLGALANCIVFQSKFVWSYIRGEDFAILRASYIDKQKLLARQAEVGKDLQKSRDQESIHSLVTQRSAQRSAKNDGMIAQLHLKSPRDTSKGNFEWLQKMKQRAKSPWSRDEQRLRKYPPDASQARVMDTE